MQDKQIIFNLFSKMFKTDDLEQFLGYLLKPKNKCYQEIARDYLSYFGNSKPTNNQIIVAKNLIIDSLTRQTLTFDEKLSLQEMKCLYLAFKGKTVSYTSQILSLNPDTIKYYRRQGIKKLNCKNMVQAAFVCGTKNFNAKFYERLIDLLIRLTDKRLNQNNTFS